MFPTLLVLAACATPEPDPDTGAPEDTADTGDTAVVDPRCPLVPEAEWLVQDWSNGAASNSMARWEESEFKGAEGTYNLYTEPGWEAVRFEMDAPVCVHAVEVAWAELPDGAATLPFGLYADFGHNGFDFHPDQPLWEGELAVGEADAWQRQVLDVPVFFAGPGLFYGASWREGEAGPSLALDGDYLDDGDCASWDECHSSVNYPGADAKSYYNGITFAWPYDFLVRVHYTVQEEFDAADAWFQVDPVVSASANVSWGDYDDDGDDDLMTNGPTLYRNDGGAFTDVTAASGVSAPGIYASGGVWGDYDNDGCLDYFGFGASTSQGDLLLHANCDGTFTDVTAASGISDWQSDRSCAGGDDPEYSPTAGGTWTDFDNDGLLDLVQANFLCFDSYTFYPDRFWHNLGDGTFEPWGEDRGIDTDWLAGRGAETIDADLDGDLDVSIVNYVLQRNLYYQNVEGTEFADEASALGLRGDETRKAGTTYYGHSIGVKWGDLDNDLDWDVVVGQLAHPRFYDFSDKTDVLLQDAGVWTNTFATSGVEYHETHSNPSLLDIENDGDLDLFITEVYAGRPTDVYTNAGDATFTKARMYAGITTENGWGSAASDYDRDGDQDYLAYSLYRNDVASGHWVELRLVGDVASNRSAIGAIAWVTAGGVTRMRSVSGGNGTGCQDSQTLHFGLGEADTVEAVEVWYPGGETVTYTGVTADGAWRLTESGAVSAL